MCELDYCFGRKKRECNLAFRGDIPAWMTEFIGTERVLRDLADEADPLIKQRLLRLANNYDDMVTTKTIRNYSEERPELGRDVN
jgi:hypothetical protein